MTDPIIKRGTVRSMIGVEVDELDVKMLVNSDVQIQGVALTQFAKAGGFDGARLSVDRSFAAAPGSTACGSLNVFTGRVSDIAITGIEIAMLVKSDLELLNVQMPRNLYMGQCVNTLYDARCGLSAAAFTVTGNTTANSARNSVNCNLAQAAGYFNLGTIKFISGLNVGVIRSVKLHTTGVIVPSFPFPFVPAAGDLFQTKPGCDKLRTTCNSAKFSNEANFGGKPFIPAPELTY